MRMLGKGFAVVALVVLGGCSRNAQVAREMSNQGDESFKAGNLDEAISKFDQAAKLDPMNHKILFKLERTYRRKEEWQKAASTAAAAQKLAPTYANYYYDQGLALKKLAEKGPTSWTEAKEPLAAAIAKDPNLADAYEDLAEVNLHLDDEQEALRNYTKAIEIKPDNLAFYGPLADLYQRLGYPEQAEQIVKEGLSFGTAAEDQKKYLFTLHSLMGSIFEMKGSIASAITEYEAAKNMCGQCQLPGEAIAYFNLGAAYAQATPPKKSEAVSQLQKFQKMICKGAAAKRYEDQCTQAQQYASKLNATLQ